jgi:hypothetical protein
VFKYFDEHKEVLLRDNSDRNESWLANEHMRRFIGWLQDRISHSSDTQTSEYIKKLAHCPIFTVITNQGYDINRYTCYTEQQDKKSTYQNSGVCVDAYDATGQDKNMYFDQFKEIPPFVTLMIKPRITSELRMLSMRKTSTGSLALTLTVKYIS